MITETDKILCGMNFNEAEMRQFRQRRFLFSETMATVLTDRSWIPATLRSVLAAGSQPIYIRVIFFTLFT